MDKFKEVYTKMMNEEIISEGKVDTAEKQAATVRKLTKKAVSELEKLSNYINNQYDAGSVEYGISLTDVNQINDALNMVLHFTDYPN